MNVLNKINLVNLPVKDQILKVDQILESFILDGDNLEIYTNEEILISFEPLDSDIKKYFLSNTFVSILNLLT